MLNTFSDAGNRVYTRVPGGIQAHYPSLEELHAFCNATWFLRSHHCRVPILWGHQDLVLHLEDLGGTFFSTYQGHYSEFRLPLHILLGWQQTFKGHVFDEALPRYDYPVIHQELMVGASWFFDRYLHSPLTKQELWEVDHFANKLSLSPTETLVHRDFHSKNLMEEGGLIDYQDMIVGPYVYDWISLFYDAYLDWPEALEDFKPMIYETLSPAYDYSKFGELWLDWAWQRLIKVVGIFVRLKLRDGKGGYMVYLPRVLGHMKRLYLEDESHPMARVMISRMERYVCKYCY